MCRYQAKIVDIDEEEHIHFIVFIVSRYQAKIVDVNEEEHIHFIVFIVCRYQAKIVDIDEEEHMVMIHFDGWNQRYDEWIKMNSEKLRPKTRHSSRKGRAKQSVCITIL
jgi:c-di-GMP-binding flagellar brake protein YcgR